jgi:hypothetical protein
MLRKKGDETERRQDLTLTLPRLACWAGVGVFVLTVAIMNCDEGPTEPEPYKGVWERVPTPKCLAGVRDICFVTANDGWAVAGHQIWHYNGKSWALYKDLHPADPRYDYGLTQVWFNGPNDGWFAGIENRTSSVYVSHMWHYDGSDFTEVPIPNVRFIYKVHFNAPDDGWAFGGDYALRYDGERWYKTEFPTYRWKGCFFWASDDGWANSVFGIWRWDGVNWNLVEEVDNYLLCIGFPARDLGWAMGEPEEYSGEPPVYRYDGKGWANYKGRWRAADDFYDVEFLSADYGWAVGLDTYFWDGDGWTLYKLPEVPDCGYDYAICVECFTENDVWVGTQDGRILRFKGFN